MLDRTGFRYMANGNKKLRETQTLRAGCSKAEPKISPRRSPLRHKESALAKA